MPFLITKFLSFIPFGNILKGTSGKIILFVGVVLLCLFVVWKYKSHIKAEVSSVFYQQQLEDLIIETKTEVKRLKEIEKVRNDAINNAIKHNEVLITSVARQQDLISSGKYKAEKVTQVIRDVFLTLRKIEVETTSSKDE